MTSRFKQFLVTDSDEDTTLRDAQETLPQPSTEAETAQTAPQTSVTLNPASQNAFSGTQVSVETPALYEATAPVGTATHISLHTATPLNRSVASSTHFVEESVSHGVDGGGNPADLTVGTSISFQESPIPRGGAEQVSASPQSINFSSAAFSPLLSVRSDSMSARPAPKMPSRADSGYAFNASRTLAADANMSAPQEGSEEPKVRAEAEQSQRSKSQLFTATTDGVTPRESGASAASDDQDKKGTKVVGRRVVERRKKGADPSDSEKLMRIDEQVIRPGRANGAASTAATPVESPRTPGGELRRLPPRVPTTRADSRGVSPLLPRRAHSAKDAQLSTRSHNTNSSVANPLLILQSSQLRRSLQMPSSTALDEASPTFTVNESDQRVSISQDDGRQTWMLRSPRRGDTAAACAQEVPPPPQKLSRRAQDTLAQKRRTLEVGVKKRRIDSTEDCVEPEKRLSTSRRTRGSFTFPAAAFYSDKVAHHHCEMAIWLQDNQWTKYVYDGMEVCTEVRRASATVTNREDTEKVVRTLQPVQVEPSVGGTGMCMCVVYDSTNEDDALRRLIDSNYAREDGVRRYLNLQPMQLANVETHQMVDPQLESPGRRSVSPSEAQSAVEPMQRSATEQRGLATLGGLWCTVEALGEDGRPAARKGMSAPRRILRICGGQALSIQLHVGSDEMFDVRCYELLLFPRESLSPSAVNYGSEGLTLGQVVAPPASSFPLTPRIIDDPVVLREYKKRLLATKSRQVALMNFEDDCATFATEPTSSGDAGKAGGIAGQYLTLTTVTISSRQKYTIELTLVMLPFRTGGILGGKTVAEVPRFCATTVLLYRRLQGLSLSFSTKSAFMSAYKALLWATECDIVDVQHVDGEGGAVSGASYSKLRVCATTSPMVPWVASFGKRLPGQPTENTFHSNCLDFSALALGAPPGADQETNVDERDPLTLEDFVIFEGEHSAEGDDDDTQSGQIGTPGRQRRRSSIYTSTLGLPKAANTEGGSALHSADTLVGLTAFGVIRRAVSQKTSEVFDVRVMPRNRGRMAPTTWDGTAVTEEGRAAANRKTVKTQEERLLQQDAEAAIMIEYVSRLPFHSRVYGVLVDDQRYYIFQEPWVSALSLEESMKGSPEHDALMSNEMFREMTRTTAVMSLKDFIHAVLHPGVCELRPKEEVWLEMAQVLAAQLLLLVTSLHGKGMLLGPCPPQRLLVRVEDPTKGSRQAEEESNVSTAGKKKATPTPSVTSSNIQLFVPDIGVNTLAWGYERQQCGVLEYLPPMYVLEQMLCDSFGREERPWTMRDDWWTYLVLCFELFAGDGSALVTPETTAVIPTPTPTLTKFFSPVHILDVWQKVITDTTSGASGTAAKTIGLRTRRYVHQRVLKSVSRFIDSWVVAKAEEMQYFGTTAADHGRRIVRAVPLLPAVQNKPIGVSLAAMYLKSTKEVSDTSSIAFQADSDEAGDGAVENILVNMPWIFQVRDFFDTILDTVFAPTPCSVHGPALRLMSHPFFRGVQLAKVFDGSHIYSAAVADYAEKHLTKSKVQAALLDYRTRTYRGLLRLRSEMPLMITGSTYSTSVRTNTGAPLRILSSPAFCEEHAVFENEDSQARRGVEVDPAEGLFFSRTNSTAPSAIPSPRSQSSATGMWGQQRLKAIYDPAEWHSIAALETEVRGALHFYGPRESVSRRRAPAEADYPSNPVSISNRPMQPMQRRSELVQAETASMTPSGCRRNPHEYEHVVDSKVARAPAAQPQRSARGSANSSFRSDATMTTSRSAFGQTNTAPLVQPLKLGAPHDSPAVSRWGSQRGGIPVTAVDSVGRFQEEGTQTPRAHRYTDASKFERRLNDLEVRHPHQRRNTTLSTSSHHNNGEVATGYDPGASQRQVQSSMHGSRPSSRQDECSNQRSWPNEFLDAATVQKKGQPHRFADQKGSMMNRTTSDEQAQHSARHLGPHSRHSGQIVHSAPSRHAYQESSSEESGMWVPSDGEEDMENTPVLTYRSNDMNRKSPTPRNPRASRLEPAASDRRSYFEF
ncbi:hypothetical protein Q4I30_006516 [Leishmania utingensis]|uniref:Protein kinase domain-containing protein n=1 Tax=Leishmania utingensis TaxID=653362 RepID=A0AAW2ZZZ2_9TRYP